MTATRIEHDSLGPVNVPGEKLWGAQTQRSLEHFRIGDDLMPREMIPAYAIVRARLTGTAARSRGVTWRRAGYSTAGATTCGQRHSHFRRRTA